MELILASTSSYRKTLLTKLGLSFRCEAPLLEEQALVGESAKVMAERLAIGKAKEVAARCHNSIVIGSDQTASVDGQLLGKPGNHENAIEQLRLCSGKTITFHTGLCVISTANDQTRSMVEDYQVSFKSLSQKQIERYLQQERPYDCAGSFKSEGLGIALFSRLNGRDPNTLVGLPLIALIDILDEFGFPVL